MADRSKPKLYDPPTEIEIADLLDQLTPAGKNILRRLVFQRDMLLEKHKITRANKPRGE